MLNTNRRPYVQPVVHHSTVRGRAFAGPQLYNTLPLEVTSSPSMEIFHGAGDWRPTFSYSHTLADTCTELCFTVLFTVFQWSFQYFCSGRLKFWLIDWSRCCFALDVILSSMGSLRLTLTRQGERQVFCQVRHHKPPLQCRSSLSWWTGLTSTC